VSVGGITHPRDHTPHDAGECFLQQHACGAGGDSADLWVLPPLALSDTRRVQHAQRHVTLKVRAGDGSYLFSLHPPTCFDVVVVVFVLYCVRVSTLIATYAHSHVYRYHGMSLEQRAQGAGHNTSMMFWQRAAGAAPAKMVVLSYQISTSGYHSLPRTLAPQAIFAGGKRLPSPVCLLSPPGRSARRHAFC
jgi:hypothetical protein